jgi:hypothetical protein
MMQMLKQARKGQSALVNENPQTITTAFRIDTTDTWSATIDKAFTGRIAHERRIVPEVSAGTAGMSTNLQRFLTTGYEVDFLQIDDIVTDQNGDKWRLGAIDPLEKFGGIYGYQAPLENANG